jgi:Na+-driven multidrug efflux pump
MISAVLRGMGDAKRPFLFIGVASAVNLVLDIIFTGIWGWGVAGAAWATIIGSLCTADWYRPIVIYKHVFHVSVKKYYTKYLSYVALGFALIAVSYQVTGLIHTPYAFVTFLLKATAAAAIPIALNTLMFWKTPQFDAIRSMFRRLSQGVMRKIKSVKR